MPLPVFSRSLLLSLCLSAYGYAAPTEVSITHWWSSSGEQQSIRVLQQHLQTQQLNWPSTPPLSGSGAGYAAQLQHYLDTQPSPTAALLAGQTVRSFAQQGRLMDLDAIAAEQGWDELIPEALQTWAKPDGTWRAIPFNTHSVNWLWINKALLDRMQLPAPQSWDELIEVLAAAQKANMIGLSVGNEDWEHAMLFASISAASNGPEYYRRALLELETQVIDEKTLHLIFQRMEQLRPYINPAFRRLNWQQAAHLVVDGQALMSVQGSWLNAEFARAGKRPEHDYLCQRFPDTQGIYLAMSDMLAIFNDSSATEATRRRLAAAMFAPGLQRDLSRASGAVPARVDVDVEAFDSCGQIAIRNMRASAMHNTFMPAMVVAAPALGPSTLLIQGRIDARQAARMLHQMLLEQAHRRIPSSQAHAQ